MADNAKSWSAPQIIWSALIAIVLWSAVGFNWFGKGFNWQTNASAQAMTTNAVKDSMATICAAQARSAPDSDAELKKLAELSSWKRREFVEKANWATMPGSEKATHGVAELCATKLTEA